MRFFYVIPAVCAFSRHLIGHISWASNLLSRPLLRCALSCKVVLVFWLMLLLSPEVELFLPQESASVLGWKQSWDKLHRYCPRSGAFLFRSISVFQWQSFGRKFKGNISAFQLLHEILDSILWDQAQFENSASIMLLLCWLNSPIVHNITEIGLESYDNSCVIWCQCWKP